LWAICSPAQFHVAQVEAATAAGKRGILCEKPLATTVEEAQLIADVSARTSARGRGCYVRLRSAVAAAQKTWGDLPDTATLVCVAV
jgi:myo-inositol 2-dehydrogenase / D-chiro-inositol 1-dehydrogenase